MQTLDCPECGEKITFQWQSEEFDCGVKFNIWKHDIKRMESTDDYDYVVVCLQDVKKSDPCTLRCEKTVHLWNCAECRIAFMNKYPVTSETSDEPIDACCRVKNFEYKHRRRCRNCAMAFMYKTKPLTMWT